MSAVGRSDRTATVAEVRGLPGWLTDAQAGRLWDAGVRARDRGPGIAVEIGSFRGRSTIVLARAVGAVIAIDPHLGGDRGPQEIADAPALGAADHDAFHRNLDRAGVSARVRHVRRRSQEALGEVPDPLALLYVDGAHRLAPAGADLRAWGARVRPGGTLLVHDAFSSVGVTLALWLWVIGRDGWRYAGRDGSLAEYRRGPALTPGERAAQLAAGARVLPYFARNLVCKVLILLGLHRRLGRPRASWPY